MLAAALLSACGGGETEKAADAPSVELARPICDNESFEGDDFTVCTADPKRDRIALFDADADSVPYRSFPEMERALASRAKTLRFAMNAGMFDESGLPIGYYVQGGERLQKLNRAKGPGNFHLLPNGVFFGSEGQWRILTTDGFAEQISKRPDFATQSGPMLLIDGQLHPKIADNGESLHVRNGVGIDGSGRARFVISNGPVSFGRLARLFRDKLGCRNALYLDGSVSGLWYPEAGRMDRGAPLGPMVGVFADER
ncbi:phosphodiester glycosidase family protein [Novosphingopyxis sp.]|uniref:phosphodiester glycosidase family protein n=1 Tax=Novosphingopyxis sp. TaxID=2709690 RepID=UPI003B5B142B